MNKASLSRQAAFYVLSNCRQFDTFSEQTIANAVKKFSLDSRDEALLTCLCNGVLQNSYLFDYYVDCYSSISHQKLQPQVLDLLRLGMYQILFLDRIPDSAAVNESVILTKQVAPKASGLVNGVLHRVCENKDHLPAIPNAGTAQFLSIRYSHPLWLCEKLISIHGYDFTEAFLAANNQQPNLSISVNLTKASTEDVRALFLENNYVVTESPIAKDSLIISNAGKVSNLPGYNEGLFFVQDEAAAYAAQTPALFPEIRILDSCAAPGGKSFRIAALLKGKASKIISCDLHEKKLTIIDSGAERLGFFNIETLPMDASKPYEQFKHSFDLVIADVPCSGFGVIRKKPEIRYKKAEDIANLPVIQSKIINAISECVKPGGELLYSTCTIFQEENVGVVKNFLKNHSDFSVLEEHTFWPNVDGTDGFYYCLLKRA